MINTEAVRSLPAGLQRTYHTVRDKWDPHFEWVVNDSSPWTLLQQPLSRTALALVGTCGAYRRNIDCAFDASNFYGDPSFKEIPRDTPPADLALAHTHFNHEHVDQAAGVGFPLTALIELEHEGLIDRVVDPAISFSGYLPQPRQLIKDTARAAARRLLEAGAQAALLVPC